MMIKADAMTPTLMTTGGHTGNAALLFHYYRAAPAYAAGRHARRATSHRLKMKMRE